MSDLFAAWVPGLPHLIHAEKSPPWKRLDEGYRLVGKHLAEFSPDVVVCYSTQWLSVLGTSFQCQPQLTGTHVDENWHELGELGFDFRTRPELGVAFAGAVKEAGMPSKTIAYDHFPIDTGTITAMRYLNESAKFPVSVVSSWVYADSGKSNQLGKIMAKTCRQQNLRVAYVACSLLSSHFSLTEIDPSKDQLATSSDDEWNKKVLGHFESGEFGAIRDLASDFTKQAGADMQFNAFHWLDGVLDGHAVKGQVHAYGPIWGTGGAVVEFH